MNLQANPKKTALALLYAIKRKVAASRLRLWKRLGLLRSVVIVPYQGFGNGRELFFLGRVLRARGIGASAPEDSRWRNFGKMYKRFMTLKIPGAKVQASYGGVTQTATTDEEGYFEFHITLPEAIENSTSWHEIKLELLEDWSAHHHSKEVFAQIFVPSERVEFGVISDIDDTVVPTGATRLWEMFKTTFMGNAHTRAPFPGVAAFYQALSKGLVGKENNPFFYVSSSPWNLYDFLQELMDIHQLPQGPLMLRDIGLSRAHLIAGSHTRHKLLQIERIFQIIADIPFILIGDSGQHDAEIYLQVIRNFPGRVSMVYIRMVGSENNENLHASAREIRALGVEIKLINNTVEAALHAISKGWILEEDIVHIIEDKWEDESEDETT